MKSILVFIGILACALAYPRVQDQVSDDVDAALKFATCFNKALDDGVPEIPLSKSNPYTMEGGSLLANFQPIGSAIEKGNLTWGGEIIGLIYNTLSIDNGIAYEDPERIFLTYKLHWKKVVIALGASIISVNNPDQKEYAALIITLNDMDFSGQWNMTKADQSTNKPGHLDEFSIKGNVENVTASWDSSLGKVDSLEGMIADDVKGMVSGLADNLTITLKNFINSYWLDHPERIQAILKHCPSNKLQKL